MDKLEAEAMAQDGAAAVRQTDLEAVWSNITNIYGKVKTLRAANALKCSVKKCDNLREKVKKMNKQLKMLSTVNFTQLEEAVTTINTFQTTINTLQTDVDANKAKLTTIEPTVTSNTEKITKVNNCFADINSADCPSARIRKGRELGTDVDDYTGNDDGSEDDDSPSVILKNIFRSSKEREKAKKNKNKRKKTRQTTQPLVPEVKALIACMTDNTASACTAKYR